MQRLLKTDIIHPSGWLAEQQRAHPNLDDLSVAEYRNWLNSLASNYADFYTHYLNQSGDWEAEEYYLLDEVFADKMGRELFGPAGAAVRKAAVKAHLKVRRGHMNWECYVLHHYILRGNFDVLFARSQPIPSRFWQRYRDRSLLVARLSARLPIDWHPNHFDLIYTDHPDTQTFFGLHGTETIINKQGFDPRVAARLKTDRKKQGIVFTGGLGTQNFLRRTEFFNRVAQRVPLTWYGYWWEHGGDGRTLEDFPHLKAAHRGATSGLPMYQAYHDAEICLNDYVDTANGIGYNQRMFEVMGAGGFLLTRTADNFSRDFPTGIFATYTDEEDCFRQIEYYLDRPEERAAIAAAGQAFVFENFSYVDIAADFAKDLTSRLTPPQPRTTK